jgi:polar amino acid transport system substrate-binding protein
MLIRAGRPSLAAGIAGTLAAAMLLVACNDGDGNGDGEANGQEPAVAEDPDLAAMVPESISQDGQILAGVDATYAPNEYLAEDGETVVGWTVDLFDAVAAKLGLTVQWQPAPFGAIIPGVQSGEYEAGVSSFTINDERKAETNMVSYYNAGTQWAAQAGTDVDPDNACGLRVAVQRDTVQVEDITARSEACVEAGEPEIEILQYQGQDLAVASVVSGQNDAMLADSPQTAFAVEQSWGELELVGDIYDAAPYGYVVEQGQTEFADALSAAVQALMDDGTYQSILEEWGVDGGAISESAVNP